MILLELEDHIFKHNASYEYINTDQIKRIRITRKRIYIYPFGTWAYIYVPKTKHNIEELKLKIGLDTEVSTW